MRCGHIIAGRFRLDAQAAEGGMGTVYRALDLSTQRPVALKVLRPLTEHDVERFRRECTLLAELHHPRVVRHVAHGETEEAEHYLAMEWVDGNTLGEVLAERGLDLRETVKMGASVAEGLAALHDAGIVHRDIKPRNLLLSRESYPTATILDLGVARQAEQTHLTTAGFMVGSCGYIAPEHARGDRNLDGRSDLFSLGCVLYECLTGEAPFAGAAMLSVRTKLLLWDPPPVQSLNPEVSDELDGLVTRLLAKQPQERPASAREVAATLCSLNEKEGLRRRRQERSTAGNEHTRTLLTHPSGAVAPVFMLFIGSYDETTPTPGLEHRLKTIPDATRFDFVGEGWFVVTLSSPQPREQVAASAAKTALELRSVFTGCPMALIGEEPSDLGSLEAMIERGVNMSTTESLLALAPDLKEHPGPGAVRVDEVTVRALRNQFPMKQLSSAFYLMQPPGAPAGAGAASGTRGTSSS